MLLVLPYRARAHSTMSPPWCFIADKYADKFADKSENFSCFRWFLECVEVMAGIHSKTVGIGEFVVKLLNAIFTISCL